MIEIGKIKDAVKTVKRAPYIHRLKYMRRARQRMVAQCYADIKAHIAVIVAVIERIDRALQQHRDHVPIEKIEPI